MRDDDNIFSRLHVKIIKKRL